jgi:acyl-CoA reductase-like NAD-dependent aldehyde dehydrogenase
MMARAIDKVGLPHGTFQLTVGNRVIGSQMVEDPRIRSVSFTGGLTGGRAIARACAEDFKATQLELGGNNALVVFADADLEKAATGIVFGMTNLNAQWCRALGRLLVHSSIKEALLERVLDKLKTIKLGDSLAEASEMGPMVNAGQYQSILGDIDKLVSKGGKALSSTPLPRLNGYFIAPTLIDGCDPADTIDEIFGPVACVHSFSTDAQALALANGTPFGLAGYVYSENEQRAFSFARQMRTGGVKINGYSLLSLSGTAPRSAWGLSGIGEEGHSQSIEFFTGARVVGVSKQDPLGGR